MANAVLMLLAFGVRLAAAWSIPALTYDGTYYLRQAQRILQGTYVFEGFPPGLPLPVALLGLTGMELELAARVLDLLAGVATVGVFHALARRFVSARAAFVLALILAVHPDFVRVQVEIWSEPLYLLATVAAFLLWEKRRPTWCGALLGYAFLLRPESLLLLAGLTVAHIVANRRVPWAMLVAGLVPVAAFSFLASREMGTFVISAKQNQWDLGPAIWDRVVVLFRTLHAVFPLLLLPVALLEGVRRRSVLLIPVLYLAALPLYAIHIQQRIHLPAVVFLAILATMWLQRQTPQLRRAGILASLALLVWGTAGSARSFRQRGVIVEHSREVGEELAPFVEFDDAIAGRFPFIPYWAGAGFVRLENLAYEALMDSIQAAGATHLLVLENEVVNVRPQLRQLFDSRALVSAESRLQLVHKVDRFPYARALLYALQPPPVPAEVPVVARDIVHATWVGPDWIAVDARGELVVEPGSDAEALRDAWRRHDGGSLRDVAVAPDVSRVAFVTTGAMLHVLHRGVPEAHAWTVRSLEPGTTGHCWIGERWILYLDADGGIHALETRAGRVVDVVVVGIPPGTPARALATRDRDIAIAFRRPTAERPLQRAVATVQWPENVAVGADSVQLDVRWGTLVQLHDDRLAWMPGRDALVVSWAILLMEDGEVTGHFASLATTQADGRMRRLSFHDRNVVAPQLHPGDPGTPRHRLLFLGTDASLQVTDLLSADTHVPEVSVFSDPQLRP